MSVPPPRLVIGLSGSSASGKTTVARLLRDILPLRTVILHQDDFFLPEAQLPVVNGLADWDSASSLDIAGMAAAMRHLRATGHVPPGFTSKEDRNEVGPSGISNAAVSSIKDDWRRWVDSDEARARGVGGMEVFVVDGFLLFGKGVADLRDGFDLRLLLRAGYQRGKERRERRAGYATIEGFWTDPPGYWDKIVWPSYVREHEFMFREGNVDGEPDQEVLERIGVKVVPGGGTLDIEGMLRWVLAQVKSSLLGP